jgi:hypothetical protein
MLTEGGAVDHTPATCTPVRFAFQPLFSEIGPLHGLVSVRNLGFNRPLLRL